MTQTDESRMVHAFWPYRRRTQGDVFGIDYDIEKMAGCENGGVVLWYLDFREADDKDLEEKFVSARLLQSKVGGKAEVLDATSP